MYTEVVWGSVYDPGVYNFSYMCIRRVATFGNFFVTEHFQRKCLETEKETFFHIKHSPSSSYLYLSFYPFLSGQNTGVLFVYYFI